MEQESLKKGVLLGALAWLCFSTMWMLSKLLQGQTSVPTMVFFRSCIGILCILPWILKGVPKSLKISNWKALSIRSLSGLSHLVFAFLAIQKISIVNTTLLDNSAPFFVPLIGWAVFKTSIDRRLWFAIFTGFIGIALILRPDSTIFNVGALYGLLAGISLAVALVTWRINSVSESFPALLFFHFSIGLILSFPSIIIYWKIADLTTFFLLCALGAVCALGQLFMYHSFKHAKASQLAPLCYTQVVFAALFSWLIWGELPTPVAAVGAFLIVLSGIWIVRSKEPQKEAT